MTSIITLTTDFGTDSSYVAQMKGVLLSRRPGTVIVDVTHSIPPQDVRYGALVLDEVCFRFPAETIHVAVVDPGVGTDREMIYAEIGGQRFLAPDNGLLGMVAKRHSPRRIVALTNRQWWAEQVSNTFHGRDVLAPVAAQLCRGLDPAQLGSQRERLLMLSESVPEVEARSIVGEVIAIDSFGNLITNVTAELLDASHVSVTDAIIECGGRTIEGIVSTYGVRPVSEVVALVGSGGRLEVAIVNGNARLMLNGRPGMKVLLTW